MIPNTSIKDKNTKYTCKEKNFFFSVLFNSLNIFKNTYLIILN